MKPVDVTDNTYIDSIELPRTNDKDPKFKVDDHVRMYKHKIFLLKDTHQTSLKKFFSLKKLKVEFHGHMLLMTNQRTNQQKFRIEKIIKKKTDKF